MTADRVYEVEVTATPEAAWAALTDPATVRRYYYGTSPRTTWEVGSVIDFVDDDGAVQLTGTILEFEPPRRLAHTFIATWYGGRDDRRCTGRSRRRPRARGSRSSTAGRAPRRARAPRRGTDRGNSSRPSATCSGGG